MGQLALLIREVAIWFERLLQQDIDRAQILKSLQIVRDLKSHMPVES